MALSTGYDFQLLSIINVVRDKDSKMKFRGCNHPTRVSRRDTKKADIDRLVLESPYSSPTRPQVKLNKGFQRLKKSPVTSQNLSKSESLDTFPPLTNRFASSEQRIRSQ